MALTDPRTPLSDLLEGRLGREVTQGLGMVEGLLGELRDESSMKIYQSCLSVLKAAEVLRNDLFVEEGEVFEERRRIIDMILENLGKGPRELLEGDLSLRCEEVELDDDGPDCTEYLMQEENNLARQIMVAIEYVRETLRRRFSDEIVKATEEAVELPEDDLVTFHVESLPNRKKAGVLTFNNPDKANAMTEAMALAFKRKLEEVKEARIDVLVVTGEGDVFSAGGDMDMIKKKQHQSCEMNAIQMHNFYWSFLEVLKLEVPIVAAINGAAIGAGLCFACACDERIAANDVNKLGFSFVKLGLTPGMGGTYFPEQVMGEEKAREMLLTGENIDAHEALRCGLVEEVVPPEKLMEFALEKANELAYPSNQAAFLDRRKRALTELTYALRKESVAQGASFRSYEHARRYTEFMDREMRKTG